MARKHRPSGSVPVPEALRERLFLQFGSEAEQLLAALDTASPVSIRLNPGKAGGPEGLPVPWCATGRYLSERPVFTLDPLFHAGCYYVQEASSMLLEQAFLASGLAGKNIAAVDLCAAPGGKSTHLATLLGPTSLLVSNEVDRRRQKALLENLWKWGREGHVITGDTPERFAGLGPLFDLVVVDAPCSGEGMMRKDPFARQQWSPALVKQCANTQRDILRHAWDMLKPGGALIYSTCTWAEEEDDGSLATLVREERAEPIALPALAETGLRRTNFGLLALPHRVTGEGFFIGALRKPGVRAESVGSPQGMEEFVHADILHHAPSAWASTVRLLASWLRVLSAGTPVSAAGPQGSTVPHAACAYVNRPVAGVEDLEVGRPQALTFLRGEVLRAEAPNGEYRRITHQGFGLGFVRGAGNRWNNLLPTEWRIRMR